MCVCRTGLGAPVVPDVQVTNATPGSYVVARSRTSGPASVSNTAGRTASSIDWRSCTGERGFTGTNTAPASQTPNMAVIASGPFANCTATA